MSFAGKLNKTMIFSGFSVSRNLRYLTGLPSARNSIFRRAYSDEKKVSNKDETAEVQSDDNKNVIPKPGKNKFKKAAPIHKTENLEEAAKDVASLIQQSGGEKKEKVQAELLSQLLGHIKATGEQKSQEMSLTDLISGMKVESNTKKPESFRGQYVRKTMEGMRRAVESRPRYQNRRESKPHPNTGSVNLFGDKGLNLFKDSSLKDSPSLCPTWDYLEKRELKIAVTHPPANYFEQMILWTEQGKLWKFPINNEQGLDSEANVDFSEHVFLEQHLEGWCPTKGPVRHFMELVCVGLSKNPYVTAEEKKEHILWYQNYFEDKKELLKDLIIDASESKPKELDC